MKIKSYVLGIIGIFDFVAERYVKLFFIGSAFVFLLLNWLYTINYPFNGDDADICLEQFARYVKGQISLFDYFTLFKNNHPTIFERIFTWLSYVLSGAVNFKIILLFSNACVLLFSFILYHQIRDRKLYLLLHILLIAFTNSIFLWPSAAGVYFFTFFTFYLTLLLIDTQKFRFVLIFIPLGMLHFYSFGNSIVTFPLFCFYILRNWKKSPIFNFLSLSIITGVFIYYIFDLYQLNAFDKTTSAFTIDRAFDQICIVFAFCGSLAKHFSFSISMQVLISIFFGLFSFLLSLYLFIKYPSKIDYKWLLFVGLVIGSGVLVSLMRYDPTYQIGIDNRYEWYGVFMLIGLVGVIFSLEEYSYLAKSLKPYLMLFVLIVSALKIGWNTLNLPRYHKIQVQRTCAIIDGNVNYPNSEKSEKVIKAILEDVIPLNIFHPEEVYCSPKYQQESYHLN